MLDYHYWILMDNHWILWYPNSTMISYIVYTYTSEIQNAPGPSTLNRMDINPLGCQEKINCIINWSNNFEL